MTLTIGVLLRIWESQQSSSHKAEKKNQRIRARSYSFTRLFHTTSNFGYSAICLLLINLARSSISLPKMEPISSIFYREKEGEEGWREILVLPIGRNKGWGGWFKIWGEVWLTIVWMSLQKKTIVWMREFQRVEKIKKKTFRNFRITAWCGNFWWIWFTGKTWTKSTLKFSELKR